MRSPIVGLLGVLVLVAGGCIVDGGGGEDDDDDTGIIHVSWSISDGGCGAVGAESVTVTAVWGSGSRSANIDCLAAGGDLEVPRDVGPYTVGGLLIDTSGNVISQATEEVASLDTEGEATVSLFFDVSFTAAFRVEWNLLLGGVAVSCADVGAATFRLMSTEDASGTYYIDLFDCVDGAGITAPLPLGGYTVAGQLLDASDSSLSDYVPLAATLDQANELVDLAFTFTF